MSLGFVSILVAAFVFVVLVGTVAVRLWFIHAPRGCDRPPKINDGWYDDEFGEGYDFHEDCGDR